MGIEFTQTQIDAIAKAARWYKAGAEQVFRVFGYAGVGKSTIARALIEDLGLDPAYGAYTGKAALVMRNAGCEGATTLHKLTYQAVQDENTGKFTFDLNKNGPISRADVVLIDECSMVDGTMGADILSFGKPVLVLGDPEQLPPIKNSRDPQKSGGFFTEATPDVMLTEIHRQAEGNPIIDLATRVRTGDTLPYGQYGGSLVARRSSLGTDEYKGLIDASDQILCGKTDTMNAVNAWVRKRLGRTSQAPEADDLLICRQNCRNTGIFTGEMFKVVNPPKPTRGKYFKFTVKSLDDEKDDLPVWVHRACFEGGLSDVDWQDLKDTQKFEFAYAITTHRAQGSQWPNVLIRDESHVFRNDARRWLYTAITRASETVTIIR